MGVEIVEGKRERVLHRVIEKERMREQLGKAVGTRLDDYTQRVEGYLTGMGFKVAGASFPKDSASARFRSILWEYPQAAYYMWELGKTLYDQHPLSMEGTIRTRTPHRVFLQGVAPILFEATIVTSTLGKMAGTLSAEVTRLEDLHGGKNIRRLVDVQWRVVEEPVPSFTEVILQKQIEGVRT